jgi:hypothetical protein
MRRWLLDDILPHVVTGGGWRRVLARDLVGFMRRHNMPVPGEIDVPSGTVMVACRHRSSSTRLRTAISEAFPGIDLVASDEEVGVGVLLAVHRPSVAVVCFPMEELRDLGVYRRVLGHCVRHGTQVVVVDTGFGETEREVLRIFGAASVVAESEDFHDVLAEVRLLLAR